MSKLFFPGSYLIVYKTKNVQPVPFSVPRSARTHSSNAKIIAHIVLSWKDWDEGLPFLLLDARECVQESTSPAELVFGHTVRRPICLLRSSCLRPPAPAATY